MTYLSRKLLPHERNYSTVEKEALAIKWAITKLSYYLLGHEFLLVTDHAPLKWMATTKDSNARVTRWFLALQAYRFRVEHRPGREHANADALSRRDACSGWTTHTQGPKLRGGICGNPTLTRPLFGRVENGIYRRWPTAGDNEALSAEGDQPNSSHLRSRRRRDKRRPTTPGRGTVGWKRNARGREKEPYPRR